MRAPMSGDRTFHVVEAMIEPGGDVGGAFRRRWSDEFKERAVAAALVPGVNVSALARQMGISPAQLFGWRRLALARGSASPEDGCGCLGQHRPAVHIAEGRDRDRQGDDPCRRRD